MSVTELPRIILCIETVSLEPLVFHVILTNIYGQVFFFIIALLV